MIQLADNQVFVRENRGKRVFDPEEIAAPLRQACRQLGFEDLRLPEQILPLIEDFLRQKLAENAELPTLAELRQMVLRMLADVGYADVAAEFARRIGQAPITLRTPPTPWDAQRVARLVRRAVPPTAGVLERITRQTLQALDSLGLAAVTDELILELARHAASAECRQPPSHARQQAPPLSPAPSIQPLQLYGENAWDDHLPRDIHTWKRAGIVRIAPVSRLLPFAKVLLDIQQLAGQTGAGPLTELAFYPRLHQAARAAARAAAIIHRLLCQRLGNTPLTGPVLETAGAAAVLESGFAAYNGRRRARLLREMAEILETAAAPQGVRVLLHPRRSTPNRTPE